MAGFQNDVCICERSEYTRTSSGQFLQCTDGTDTFGLYNSAGSPESSIAADIGSLGLDTTNGDLFIKKTDSANTGWGLVGGDGLNRVGAYNIAMSLSSGVLTISAANGSAFSAQNPGYVFLPSSSTPGQAVRYKLTSNYSVEDASGTSELIGNLFGTVTTESWGTNDIPFYLYAVANDDEDEIAMMISRVPHQTQSPVAASIGAPDDPVADTQGSFFSLENLDETLFDSNPCVAIGSFRMRKDASDDWTIQSLSFAADGIGVFQEATTFTFPLAVNGASAGTFFKANGGTAPLFTTNTYVYRIRKNGMVEVNMWVTGDPGTDGAGAVSAQIALPLLCNNNLAVNHFFGYGRASGATVADRDILFQIVNSANTVVLYQGSSGNFLQNAGFGNGARFVSMTLWYWMEDDA